MVSALAEGNHLMNENLVMTVIGDDRPGLVEMLAHTVSSHDGSWLESRMARLGGKFAGILRVSIPADSVDSLLETLRGLDEKGLRVTSERSIAPEPRPQPVRLELVGSDHLGIVRDISALLTRQQINVEEFTSDCEPAPMSGQQLFKATVLLHLPVGLTADELRTSLEGLATDLMVDITLS
jgi:glycine cleavage system regulatory protein